MPPCVRQNASSLTRGMPVFSNIGALKAGRSFADPRAKISSADEGVQEIQRLLPGPKELTSQHLEFGIQTFFHRGFVEFDADARRIWHRQKTFGIQLHRLAQFGE